MKSAALVLGASALITSSASATVTGLSVERSGTVAGLDIYSVYVLSSGQNAAGMHDVMLNIIGHQVIAGSMANVLHNDNWDNAAGDNVGHWNASYTSSSTGIASNQWKDSYVTVTGKTGLLASTTLDPSFGTGINDMTNPSIPAAAGWYTANPAVDILITGGKIKVMQIAVPHTIGPGSGGAFEYTGKMSVGYKLQGTASPLYAMFLTYSIPAPGALALLGFAGAFGGRGRRRS